MLLLSMITFLDNFPSRHCPHAVFTTLGNNKSEGKEGKTRQINFGLLFTVEFTSTQYSTMYMIIDYDSSPGSFFCKRISLLCKLLVAISSIAQCLCVDFLPYRQNMTHIFLLHLCPNT